MDVINQLIKANIIIIVYAYGILILKRYDVLILIRNLASRYERVKVNDTVDTHTNISTIFILHKYQDNIILVIFENK